MYFLTLEFRFSAAHFYHQPAWSEEKNRETFGRCFTKYGHGHNYFLSVKFESRTEFTTSEILQTRQMVKLIIDAVDHKHLNFDIPEFSNVIPTSEMLALYFKEKISALGLPPLLGVELFEDFDIGASWSSSGLH